MRAIWGLVLSQGAAGEVPDGAVKRWRAMDSSASEDVSVTARCAAHMRLDADAADAADGMSMPPAAPARARVYGCCGVEHTCVHAGRAPAQHTHAVPAAGAPGAEKLALSWLTAAFVSLSRR